MGEINLKDIRADMNLLSVDKAVATDLVAVGDVTVSGWIVIHNVKVINLEREGKKQLTAVLPNKQNKAGKWENVFSVSSNLADRIKQAAIEDTLEKQKRLIETAGFESEFEVSVTLCREDYWPTLGYAVLNLGSDLSVKKIRIVDDNKGGIRIQYPTLRNSTGQYIQLFSGATPTNTELIDHMITVGFKNKYFEEKGKEYTPAFYHGQDEIPDSLPDSRQYTAGGIKR